MHYWQSGASYRRLAAEYTVRAGERLLRTYGFRPAIEAFDRALKTFEEINDSAPDYVRRALEGLGLAYESLFDAEGVTSTYRKLQTWARKQGDRPLMIATYSRLTTMLGLFGQQSESNVQLRELLRGRVNIGLSRSWIVPVIYGSENDTILVADYLHRHGQEGSVMEFPAVPVNEARIRLFVTSEHQPDQIDACASNIIAAARHFGFVQGE